jgi:hypothetical protein
MEGRIFKEFGQQLRESIVKGFNSDESESREHVVAFIGTLYKEVNEEGRGGRGGDIVLIALRRI